MNEIWANRIIAGTKMWSEVPEVRKADVKAALAARVEAGKISAERYADIIGEDKEE